MNLFPGLLKFKKITCYILYICYVTSILLLFHNQLGAKANIMEKILEEPYSGVLNHSPFVIIKVETTEGRGSRSGSYHLSSEEMESDHSLETDSLKPKLFANYQIQFELTFNLMLVEGRVNGRSGVLILDTGLDHMVINENYFRGKLSDMYISGITGDLSNSACKYVEVEIGNVPFYKTNAHIANLDDIEKQLNMEVLGFCGVNFLKRYQWLIHYNERRIDLLPLDDLGEQLVEMALSVPDDIIQLKKLANFLYAEVIIGGRILKLALDTGSSASIIDKKYEDSFSDLFADVRPKKIAKIIGINGARKLANTHIICGLQIGTTTIPKTRVKFTSLHNINRGRKVKLDGIFNPIIMRHGTIAINWQKQQLYIWEDDKELKEELLVEGGK